ncbi:Neuroblastoma-amplified sequence [Blattella germanica]|nr:Neuroblastoma-amplified sequence [Blattella germanica]
MSFILFYLQKYLKGDLQQSSTQYILQFLRKQESSDEVQRILLRQLPWHFAVGEGGKVVAVLQDTVLEIRTSRDEYSSVLQKTLHHNGESYRGVQIAVCLQWGIAMVLYHFMIFLEVTFSTYIQSAELVIIDYQGELRCYLVSPTDGYQESHNFSFSQHYPHGITAVSYHPAHNMLFLAGPSSLKHLDVLKNLGSSLGLSAWRLLNDYPYCTIALSSEEEQAIWQAQRSWWNWVPSVSVKTKQSVIFKMQISPGGKFLACLHSCGSFSIWHLPGISEYWCHPVDVNWWSDQAVIIARHSGAISVCSVGNLHNLLGESPEFLAGSPQVSALCSDQGFLGLECETVSISKKWAWDEHTMYSEMESSDDNEDDSDDDASLLNKSSALLQSAVYVVTDIERFQPKKKKPKLCVKTYRLLGLKSTTPDELYARKIDNEEYGEALALAKAYNLDCDLVYQQQWRNNKVSIVTIHDYLSKVSKRTWVLKECVERVPETFGAARELLEFGLQETSAEKLFSFGDDEMLDLDSNVEINAAEKIMKMTESLSKISLNDLTSEQQTLLKYRQQLLEYFDRLCTYELIMGGPHMAEDCYDYMFYDKFRTVSLIESTVKFARESNWKAVETMFTYHGSIILPHWLAVLSNFPETMNPQEYRSLLPECDSTGHLFQWTKIQRRSQDWCENSNFEYICKNNRVSDAEFIYKEDESLQQFICKDSVMSADTLASWFVNRVHKIESQSCMVDYALSLTKLGKERNVTGLENLYNQLLTLDTLVYDVHLENVRLLDLQKMSQLDICKLLMSKTTKFFVLQSFLKLTNTFCMAKMEFLRFVAVYTLMDRKRNEDIRRELEIFNLTRKIEEY